ncbi:MAG: nicotinate-nucleotide--dimethylbenzimidazole phosphoribosyltransferase [Desulfobulbus sp.]|nr:nicotinate-nucleotide--dimethylbenzimidazole phosphoribosyltransferase [Desulfobulbus sp.]
MNTNQSLSFLETAFRSIYPQDFDFRQQAEERLGQLTMPHWAMGDLMDLAVDLVGMTRSMHPPVARKKVVVMVGDHGVTVEGVSCYPAEVTTQMVHNFTRGGAAINVLARRAGADVCVVDVGAQDDFVDLVREGKVIGKKIGRGTANMVYGPAMTRTHAVMAVEAGVEVANMLASEVDVFATGEMGIGNTTPSTAIAAVFTGKKVADLTGRGTGLDDTRLEHKITVIEKSLARNTPNAKDGLDVLAKVGGFEIGGIAGLIIGAAAKRKPVVVDGFIATAGAMIACSLEPFVRDYLIFAHRSAEPGHLALLEKLQQRPLLDLNMRLGEGTGAVLAMNLLDAAVALLTEMATFAEAGVSRN